MGHRMSIMMTGETLDSRRALVPTKASSHPCMCEQQRQSVARAAHLLIHCSLAIRLGDFMSAVLGVNAMVGVRSNCRGGAAKGSVGATAGPIQDPLKRMQEAEADDATNDTCAGT